MYEQIMYPVGTIVAQPQPAHPLLDAISDYTDADIQPRGSSFRHYQHQQKHPYHHFAAATDPENAYTSSGASGYGIEPSAGAYGSQHYAHSAPPSGGGYSYHPSGPSGTGYGAPHHIHQSHPHSHPHPPAHPPPTPPATFGFGKIKKGGSSVMTALTLLSFFFFVNMLQSCLKEQMTAMNPTIMVMTTGVRNRHTKLSDMNSREQSTSPASISTDGHIVVQPEDVISAAAAVKPANAAPTITLQSPYSSAGLQHNKYGANNKPQQPNINNDEKATFPTPSSETFSYPNRTDGLISTYFDSDGYQAHNPYIDHHYQRPEDPYSYKNPYSRPSDSTSSIWSSRDRYPQNHYYGHDRNDDEYYTRIN